MNLLERYIFRRTLSLSLMTLSATTVMVLITQVLIYVNLLTASGQALITFFALAATLDPADAQPGHAVRAAISARRRRSTA